MNPYRSVGKRKSWSRGGDPKNYTVVDTQHLRAVHQGDTNGCALAAVLYLLQFKGVETPDVQHPDDFAALYTSMGLDPSGYNTFARALEDMHALPLQHLHYVWIRYADKGRTTRSKPTFNPEIVTKHPTQDILRFLRALLDQGHPFAAPFDGHFCTFVGHNPHGFLALGSYGDKGLHEVKETTLFADAVNAVLW